MLKFGLIGAGVIGRRRVQALHGRADLVAVADILDEKSNFFAGSGVKIFLDWRDLLAEVELDAVIVATTHDVLAEITTEAIRNNINVFVEKPAARNVSELLPILDLSEINNIIVRVGFNHRFHRSMIKAKALLSNDAIGPLMYIRGRYGHGGRLGYDKEWRSDFSLSGGGELIDQGPHLIDLSRWFFEEDFAEVAGTVSTYFWKMPVDDNAFMTLTTATGKIAFLHVSCTEWKNLFSLEIYGKSGKIELTGLGGSYGTERITLYKMLPEMGPPDTRSWEYPMPDNSWNVEINSFIQDIENKKQSTPNLNDAYHSLDVINKIYGKKYDNCKKST